MKFDLQLADHRSGSYFQTLLAAKVKPIGFEEIGV